MSQHLTNVSCEKMTIRTVCSPNGYSLCIRRVYIVLAKTGNTVSDQYKANTHEPAYQTARVPRRQPMILFDKLNDLLKKQQDICGDCKTLIEQCRGDSLIQDNIQYRQRLAECEAELETLKKARIRLDRENSTLKTSLLEQVVSEKLSLLKISKEKLLTYFREAGEHNTDALSHMSQKLHAEIDALYRTVAQERALAESSLYRQIEQLRVQIDEHIAAFARASGNRENSLYERIESQFRDHENEKPDEETLEKRIRNNRIEMNIGLRILNVAGIILILAGAGVAATYSYNYISNTVKGALFYVCGLAALAAGELLFRAKKSVFSFGVLGGGIGILYTAVFYSYFFLKLSDMNTALLLSLLITAASIALSLRYGSVIILNLGLAGGFLPFVSYAAAEGFPAEMVTPALVYLLILNMTALVISFFRKWNATDLISLVLHYPAVIYLVQSSETTALTLAYISVVFVIYLAAVMSPSFSRRQRKAPLSSLIALVLNCALTSLLLYFITDKLDLSALNAPISLGISALLIFCGYSIKRSLNDRRFFTLLYLTGLTFSIMVIPLQFGIRWVSMGLVVQSALMMIAGSRFDHKEIEWGGYALGVPALVSFAFFDTVSLLFFYENETVYVFKFTVMVIASLAVFIAYIQKLAGNRFAMNTRFAQIMRIAKAFIIVTTTTYLFYITYYVFDKLNINYLKIGPELVRTCRFCFAVIILLSSGLIWDGIKILKDSITAAANVAAAVVAVYLLLFFILPSEIIISAQTMTAAELLSFVLLSGVTVLTIYSLWKLLLRFFVKNEKNFEWFPVILTTAIVLILSVYLYEQFRFAAFSSFIITTFYFCAAVAAVLFGFARRFVYIRYYGLILCFIALGKFFIWDIRAISTPFKIAAYFSYGSLLLLISFVYQRINASLSNARDDHEK